MSLKNLEDYSNTEWTLTAPPKVNWVKGSGATSDDWRKYKKIEFDALNGRTGFDNYKLLISGIVPRPIGFIATISKDGVHNLSPFSYFNVVNADPPVFTIGFSTTPVGLKNTPQNILDTEELTINIISEWFVDAANETAAAAPAEVDEWKLSGLTPAPSSKVKPPHVAESAFSIEAKLLYLHKLESKTVEGKHSGTVLIVEGVNFHAREDVINKDLNNIDINKLKPVARLDGITYAVSKTGFEIPFPQYNA